MEEPTDSAIKVSVRIRPLNQREKVDSDAQKESFEYNDHSVLERAVSGTKVYRFDHCFGPDTPNVVAYDKVGKSLVMHAMGGWNATIFTYGQTGSGKTHSILGTADDPGFIPRCIDDIFDFIENRPDTKFTLKCSYLEVYNEEINDLLNEEEEGGQNLRILSEDPQKGAIIETLIEAPVETKLDVKSLLKAGENKRSYGATNMNDTSSRSHTLFRLIIESYTAFETDEDGAQESKGKVGANGFQSLGNDAIERQGSYKISYLNLVDLAGSERQKSTGATGSQLKEGSNINKSLLALGAVISKLGESARKASRSKNTFIPFRDSKLTRILKNSLGGNTLTSILCTLTAAPMHHDETISTLKFGQLCKTIKNHAHKNETVDDKTRLKVAQARITELTNELKEKEGGSEIEERVKEMTSKVETERQRSEDLQKRLDSLQAFVSKRGSVNFGGAASPVGGRNRTLTRSKSISFNDGSGSEALEEAAEQKRIDDEMIAHQSEEIDFLNQQVEEFQRDRDEDRSTISKLKIYRSDFVAATEQIQEYQQQLEELQQRENEGLANMKTERRELEMYHDNAQKELDTRQQQVDTKAELINAAEESLTKKRSRLEEMENHLSQMFAVLDEKESELQQQMNTLSDSIKKWSQEKRELNQREDQVLQWTKDYKTKEYKLDERANELNSLQQELEEWNNKIKEEEQNLLKKEENMRINAIAIRERTEKLEKKEKVFEEDSLKITEWKKILKTREIEVEERERTANKNQDNSKREREDREQKERELAEFKEELLIREEELAKKDYEMQIQTRKNERLRPVLEKKQSDCDNRERNLKEREKAVTEMMQSVKEAKHKNEEHKLEIVIKTRHLKERETIVQKKEVEYKDIINEKRDLEQRASKQEYKEKKWQSNVAQINSSHAAAIEEVEGYLKEQIEVACVFEEDLKKTREMLNTLRREHRVVLAKLESTQAKYEEALFAKQQHRGETGFARGGLFGLGREESGSLVGSRRSSSGVSFEGTGSDTKNREDVSQSLIDRLSQEKGITGSGGDGEVVRESKFGANFGAVNLKTNLINQLTISTNLLGKILLHDDNGEGTAKVPNIPDQKKQTTPNPNLIPTVVTKTETAKSAINPKAEVKKTVATANHQLGVPVDEESNGLSVKKANQTQLPKKQKQQKQPVARMNENKNSRNLKAKLRTSSRIPVLSVDLS